MISVTEKANCCGCTACASSCLRGAIEMLVDSEGFIYPEINKDICIDCGVCEKSCAFHKRLVENKPDKKPICVYAATHKDYDVLRKSTSGGMFTALSDKILTLKGVVYGAAFSDDFTVIHIRAEDESRRNEMRGSKYVQSDIRSIFPSVKTDLENNRVVLFTGTPCQIDGLLSYLGSKPNNLICCDLVCHGTPSPLIWKQHVNFISRKNKSKLTRYEFRPKNWGWHEHNELAVFANKREYHSCGYSNLFRNLYYSRLIMRPSCHNCPYTNLSRPSDITIADCRGIEKVIPTINSNEGVSLVMINTLDGEMLFDKINKCLEYEVINIEEVMQPPLIMPSNPGLGREKFWNAFYKAGYKYAVDISFGKLYSTKYSIKKSIKKFNRLMNRKNNI